MNTLSKKGKERIIKQKIVGEMEYLAEHCDLLTLVALHEEFGFGAERLRKFYSKMVVLHDEFKDRYMASDDKVLGAGRCDTYAIKMYLKRIGFDYDKECELLCAKGGGDNAD